MEQTTVGTERPHFIRQIFQFKTVSPIIARATPLVMITLVIAVLIVSTVAKDTGSRITPDPFTAFADVFPGQSVDTRRLEAQGYSCHDDILPTPADITERCTRTLSTGTFSHINLTIWDGVVVGLDLEVRDNNLNVGDLSLQWGHPEVRFYGNWVNLSWPKQHVKGWGWSSNGSFTYFQTLSHITFAI